MCKTHKKPPEHVWRQGVKQSWGGVGGPAGPLTVIVSRGFAARAGCFWLARNVPYTSERLGRRMRLTSEGVQTIREKS